MRGMTRGQVFELVFWSAFAIGAYAISFKFDRDIEIYEYGASGWPRGVLVFIVLAVIGQLIHDFQRRHRAGDAPGPGNAEAELRGASHGARYYLRVASIMGLPVLYAFLMQPIGFYSLTPVFIVAFLLLGGERRVVPIALVTLFLYAAFIFLFAKLLYVGLPTGNVHPFYDFSNWLLIKLH